MKTQLKASKAVVAAIVMATVAGIPTASAGPSAGNSENTRDIVVSIGDAYIPSGFDSASDAFVVVNGLFPNTCYSWKEAQVKNTTDTEHEVRAVATVKGSICMMVLVPYQHEVQLGRLTRGEHTLKFVSGDGTYIQKRLKID